jgi:hypothetical protein
MKPSSRRVEVLDASAKNRRKESGKDLIFAVQSAQVRKLHSTAGYALSPMRGGSGSAGTGGVDTLTNPPDRSKVVRFLESIDAATAPIF